MLLVQMTNFEFKVYNYDIWNTLLSFISHWMYEQNCNGSQPGSTHEHISAANERYLGDYTLSELSWATQTCK